MKYTEAEKLKVGDLVIIDKRTKRYAGLILEIEEITGHNNWCYRVTLKQAYLDGGFRIRNYDTRHLQRYEP